MKAAKWLMILSLAVCVAVLVPAAHADSFTLDYSASNGSGPFGTVDLTSIDANTVQVTLTLTSGEVFAVTGAGAGALGFSVDKSYTLVSSPALTSGFSLSTPGTYSFASSIGDFTSVITCSSCGNGTSPPNYSGPVTFQITNAGGLSISDFITNKGGYMFASDIGSPDGQGGFNTFVVGGGPSTSVPEPGTLSMLGLGLGLLAFAALRRKQAVQVLA